MAVIGRIAVDLTARTQNFVKGIGKSSRSLKGFGKTLGGASKALGIFGAAISAGAIVAGFKTIIKGSLESADALGKVSDRLGILPENLAGLHHAGEQTGVSIETMNMALQRMVRRIAEAAQGTGEAQKAIAELGLDAQQLAQMSPDEQFKAIAKAMEGVANQGDKVRLAMRFFDSEGVKLLNTLELGADGMERMQQEAEALGIALTRDQIAAIEKANDSWDVLTKVWKGAALQLTAEMAPAMADITSRVVDMAQGFKQVDAETGLTGIQETLNGIELGVAGIIDAWNIFVSLIENAQLQYLAFEEIALKGAKAIADALGLDIADDIESLQAQVAGQREQISASVRQTVANPTAATDAARERIGERTQESLRRLMEQQSQQHQDELAEMRQSREAIEQIQKPTIVPIPH